MLASNDSSPIGVTGIKKKLERHGGRGEKVGIALEGRKITPHCFRHGLNSHWLAKGLFPLLVQSYLGWTSAEGKLLTRVQAKYTHLQLMKLEDVAATIDRIYMKPRATKAKAG